MSRELQRAIANYLVRPWWAWVLAAFVQFAATLPLLRGNVATPLVSVIPAFTVATYLHTAGWLRVMSTLPMTRKEIGYLRWWSVIGVPGIILTLATLMPFVAVPFMVKPPPLWPILVILARLWSALGLMATILAIGRRPFVGGFFKRALSIGLFGLVGAVWFVDILVPSVTAPAMSASIAAFGLVAVAYHFGAAQSFVQTRPIAERAGEVISESRPGPSGWLVIIRQQAVASLIWFAWVIGAVLVPFVLLHRVAEPPIYIIAIIGFAQRHIWTGARAYRVLPITTSQLVLALLSTLLIPGAVAGLSAYVIGLYLPAHWSLMSLALFVCLSSLGLPVSLRFGGRPLMAAFVTVGLLAVVMIAASLSEAREPITVPARAAICVVLLTASLWWSRYELRSGTHAYRARPTPGLSFSGGFLAR